MMTIIFTLLIIFVQCFFYNAVLVRAPSVFRKDESELHKYSAVLAATEPFRLMFEEQIRSINPFVSFVRSLFGKSIYEQAEDSRFTSQATNSVLTRYETRIANTLRSYSIKVDDFNKISAMMARDAGLRRRILLQAYLYKLAADLDFNLRRSEVPRLPSLSPTSISSTQVALSPTSPAGSHPVRKDGSEMERFAEALQRIEAERLTIRRKIQRDLQLDELPPRMDDFLPAMCPAIQRACRSFPQRARTIIEEHGLQADSFQQMQEKLEKNLLYRWQVQQFMRQRG